MALGSGGRNRFSVIIWPGFVDVMTALVLVLFFVLSIFMIVQFVLRDTITGQGQQLEALSVQVANLADALGLERSRADRQASLVSTLTAEKQATEAKVADFETQVASLIARNTDLSKQLTTAAAESAERLSAQQALEASLAQARGELDKGAEEARLAAARREALEALVRSLQSDVAGMKDQATAQAAKLGAAEAARLAAAAATEELRKKLAASDTQLTAAEQARLAQLAVSDEMRKRLADADTQLKDAEAARLAQAQAVEDLRKKLANSDTQLSDAEAARLADAAAGEELRKKLASSGAELTAMTMSLEAERKKAENTLTLLAAAEAAKSQLQGSQAQALSEAQRRAAELAQANVLLSEQKEVSAEEQRQVALLNQQTAQLRDQMNALQGVLDTAQAKDTDAQVQIDKLGANLNAALARVAVEERARAELEAREKERLAAEAQNLESYRSEFFGRMREILGEREGVQVVGDRFVFPSEVLFAPGSATLGAEGQAQVARVAQVIREIAGQIPPGINWVLRVDGHTDKTPVTPGGPFRDNWELSQARALSVVRYMTQVQGLPPDRLAATGFGEFQPIDPGDSPEALAKNRRIELKFTER